MTSEWQQMRARNELSTHKIVAWALDGGQLEANPQLTASIWRSPTLRLLNRFQVRILILWVPFWCKTLETRPKFGSKFILPQARFDQNWLKIPDCTMLGLEQCFQWKFTTFTSYILAKCPYQTFRIFMGFRGNCAT